MREMKDSGIEWIGQIPKGWELRRAKTLFTQRNSKGNEIEVLLSPTQKYGVVPQSQLEGVVQVKEDADLQMFKTVHKGDFVISLRSFQGGFEYSLYEGVCSPAYQVFYPTSPICDTYYRYLFKSQSFISKMNNLTVGIREGKNIQYVDFANSQIPVPPLAEQERIAAFLDAECAEIDAVLEKTRASIEEYKKLKQAVITQAVTKGIRGDRPMKDSGIEWIGEIPAEWSVVKGRRLILATQNGLTRRDLEKSEGYIVLKLKNLDADGSIDYSEVNRVALTDEEKYKYQLCDGDFLFVRVNGSRNLVGKCAIYHDVGEIVAYNDHIIRVKLNDLCLKEYFHYYLLSIAGKREIELHTSTAAGQFTISGDGLRELCVVLPGIVEQAETVAYLDKKSAGIDALIAKKQQYLTEIENYKKSLIYEYVTGKKEVV